MLINSIALKGIGDLDKKSPNWKSNQQSSLQNLKVTEWYS